MLDAFCVSVLRLLATLACARRSRGRMARRSGFFLESGQAGHLPSLSIVTVFSRSTCHSSMGPERATSRARLHSVGRTEARKRIHFSGILPMHHKCDFPLMKMRPLDTAGVV